MKLSGLLVVLLAAGYGCGTPPLRGELGSPRNPVRAHTVRLRCPDGRAPQFQGLTGRKAHGLRGPYGNFVNGYRVRCTYLNTEFRVFFDPHHLDYAEPAAVPGFVVTPPDRKRLFWFER